MTIKDELLGVRKRNDYQFGVKLNRRYVVQDPISNHLMSMSSLGEVTNKNQKYK